MPASRASTRAPSDALRIRTGLARAVAFCLGVALAALSAISLQAADLPGQSPSPMLTKAPIADDWTGFYVGGHVGFASAGSGFTATQPGSASDLTGTLDLFRRFDFYTGEGSIFAGFQAGYNTLFTSGLLLGIEADISFPDSLTGTSILATPSIGAATYSDLVEMAGSVRGRVGYAFDHWLYYGTAGYAWSADRLTRTQLSDNSPLASGGTVEIKLPRRNGWTAGAGVEAPLVPHWTARIEYLYSDFGTASVTFPLAGQRFDSNLSAQILRTISATFWSIAVVELYSSIPDGSRAPLC
jgi:high affinity Mn2+ porin